MKSHTQAGKSEKRKSADRRYTRYINDRLYLLIIHRSISTPMNCMTYEINSLGNYHGRLPIVTPFKVTYQITVIACQSWHRLQLLKEITAQNTANTAQTQIQHTYYYQYARHSHYGLGLRLLHIIIILQLRITFMHNPNQTK